MSAIPSRSRRRQAVTLAHPWYPVAFAATYVINLWVDSGVSVLAVTRSLVVAIVGAALLIGICAVVMRHRHLGAAAALLVLLALLSRGITYLLGLLVLVVAASLAVLLWGRIRRRSVAWREITAALNVVSGLLLVVVLAGGVLRGNVGAVFADLQQGGSLEAAAPRGGPDLPSVYVLLLDGYPRADSFARLFGGDNAPFIEDLEARGFSVAAKSQSNYMFTQLTLTSMFHMRPLLEIPELQAAADGEIPGDLLMRQTLNDSPAFDILRDRGYEVVTSSSGYEHVALRQSDVYLDEGQLNEFEYQLLRFTTVQRIVNAVAPEFFADQQRDRIRSGFRHFRDVTSRVGGPTFAFIHLPTPHLPVVFEEDGSDAFLPPSEDIFDWAEIDPVTREAYARQLVYVNSRVLELVDATLAAHEDGDVEPAIIVMSDHGAAPRPAIFIGEGTDDHYANFFAARIPAEPDLFEDDISPVNVFPALFNAYFDMNIDQWPNERYGWVGAP